MILYLGLNSFSVVVTVGQSDLQVGAVGAVDGEGAQCVPGLHAAAAARCPAALYAAAAWLPCQLPQ